MRAISAERAGQSGTILLVSSRLVLALGVGIALLASAGLGTLMSVYLLPDFPGRDTFVELFTLDGELNVPTWYSSALLLVAAGLLGMIAWTARLEGAASVRSWAGLAVVFVYLSVDEAASIHERYLGALSPLPERGVVLYGWVVPAAVFVMVLTVVYARFVFLLPPPVRRLAVAAAALYVGGALGLELVEAVLDEQGPRTIVFAGIAGLEDVLEMAGALVFIVALLRYIRLRHPGARLALDAELTDVARDRAADSKRAPMK